MNPIRPYTRATEASCLDQRANRWSEQTAARHPRCAGCIASCADTKSDHERCGEKEDCGYSKRKVGKGSSFKIGDRFCQTRGQEDRNQYGYPGEVVGEIEGLLGGEEKSERSNLRFLISVRFLS